MKTNANILSKNKVISVFKTSINEVGEVQKIKPMLNLVVGKNQWNFDLEDCDNILRIQAHELTNNFLIQEMNKLGYLCKELV